MHIIEDLCRPDDCQHECISACKGIHGDELPLVFDEKRNRPIWIQDDCTSCLLCVKACPFKAISPEDEPVERVKPKQVVSSIVQRRPYETRHILKQFEEKNIIFARVFNDPSFKRYQQTESHKSDKVISRKLPGYDRFGHELSAAGWKLYDNRYAVDRGKVSGSQGEISRKRVKSDYVTLTRNVKRSARFFGASQVGVAELDRRWLYSSNRRGEPYDIPEDFQRVIVMTVEMNYDEIMTSPAYPSSAASVLAYSKMAFMEIELSEFIRRLGYRAIPCGNDVGLSVPMAIDAGLGQYGRHGLLITERYGPRVRIAKVLTDMPLLPDTPDLRFTDSVIRFCEVCMKCADHCPSQSISHTKERTWKGETKSNNPGTKKWYVDVESCYNFWVENGGDCSNCIRSCPYNKPDNLLHKLVVFVTKFVPWFNRFVVKIDDLLGFGRQRHPRTVWSRYD
jgi:reductive dehalogenase